MPRPCEHRQDWPFAVHVPVVARRPGILFAAQAKSSYVSSIATRQSRNRFIVGAGAAALIEQRKPDGRIVISPGLPEIQQLMQLTKQRDGKLAITEILPVRFSTL